MKFFLGLAAIVAAYQADPDPPGHQNDVFLRAVCSQSGISAMTCQAEVPQTLTIYDAAILSRIRCALAQAIPAGGGKKPYAAGSHAVDLVDRGPYHSIGETITMVVSAIVPYSINRDTPRVMATLELPDGETNPRAGCQRFHIRSGHYIITPGVNDLMVTVD